LHHLAGFLACHLFPFPVSPVVLRKDPPIRTGNDFTAAGTAPEFHRIPFSSNMEAPRRLQIYKYYFEAIPFLTTFATGMSL
jgi:hypothetical protein